MKNWPTLILDELPSVIKPLFFLSIYLLVFLLLVNNLDLSYSYWFGSKESILNVAFYLGCYALIFMAIHKVPLEIKKEDLKGVYRQDQLNKGYYLIQYEGFNEVYVFEKRGKKRKLWIKNPTTKRYLWGGINAKRPSEVNEINFKEYRENQEIDGSIDITSVGWKGNLVVFSMSAFILVLATLILP